MSTDVQDLKKLKNAKKRAKAKAKAAAKREQEIVDKVTAGVPVELAISNSPEVEAKKEEAKKEAKKQDEAKNKEIDDIACTAVGKLWKYVLSIVDTPEKKKRWGELSDRDKTKLIDANFKDVTNLYPIVCKYIVFAGQYSETAFRRYLVQCRKNRSDMRPVDPHDVEGRKAMKKEAQKNWCINNAWYSVYLWEAYKRIEHPNVRLDPRSRRGVYANSLDLLMKEFGDMDELKETAEITVKEREDRVTKQAVNEVVGSLKDGAYKNFDIQDKLALLELLKSITAAQPETKKKKTRKRKPKLPSEDQVVKEV